MITNERKSDNFLIIYFNIQYLYDNINNDIVKNWKIQLNDVYIKNRQYDPKKKLCTLKIKK